MTDRFDEWADRLWSGEASKAEMADALRQAADDADRAAREDAAAILDERAALARAQATNEYARANDQIGAQRRLWWARDCELIAAEIRSTIGGKR